MKRLSLIGSWKRIGVQMGLLAGIGLAFVGGSEPPVADAAPKDCQLEGNCTFKKPLFGIILDYSSSMNEMFDANQTRWQGAVAAISAAIDFDNGYIAENFILGLVRFGHDPDPNVAGSKIAADTSGLTDGQKLDVPWYDPQDPAKKYIECTNGDAIIAALAAAGAPSGGNKTGIGTWTKGAMDFVKAYIATSKADHPMDGDKRKPVLMVVTDGKWTNPQGNHDPRPPRAGPVDHRRRALQPAGDPDLRRRHRRRRGRGLRRQAGDGRRHHRGHQRCQPAGPRRRPLGSHRQDQDGRGRPRLHPRPPAHHGPDGRLLVDAQHQRRHPAGPRGHGRLGPGSLRPRRRRLDLRPRPHEQQQGGGPRPPRHLRVRPQRAPGGEGPRPVRPLPQGQLRLGPRPRHLLRAPRLRRPLRRPADQVDLQGRLGRGSAELRREDPQPHAQVRPERSACPWPASAPAPSRTSAST
jgi:hypothetical protein